MRTRYVDPNGNEVPRTVACDSDGQLRNGYGLRVAATLMDGTPGGHGISDAGPRTAAAQSLLPVSRFHAAPIAQTPASVREMNEHRAGWAQAMRHMRAQDFAERHARLK